jgi:hypothetical protein
LIVVETEDDMVDRIGRRRHRSANPARWSPFEILQQRRPLMDRLRLQRGDVCQVGDGGNIGSQREVPILRDTLTFDGVCQKDDPQGAGRERSCIHHDRLSSVHSSLRARRSSSSVDCSTRLA